MNKIKTKYFRKGDLDATIGVFFDGFSKVLAFIGVALGTFLFTNELVFKTLVPGIFMGVLFLNGGLYIYYLLVQKKHNLEVMTAIPGGIQAGRVFLFLFSVMMPVYLVTEDALLTFKVAVLANFISSAFILVSAFFVPLILKYVPKAALFGALAGGALCFLILNPFQETIEFQFAGMASLFLMFLIYFGKIKLKISPALIVVGIGTIIAWLNKDISSNVVTESTKNLSLNFPKVTLNIFETNVLQTLIPYLPTILVFSLIEVIANYQAVSQAKEEKDEYFDYKMPIIISGAAGMISSLFGNPLALGMFWGYPGWKKAKAGTFYHMGNVIIYAVICLTGLTALVNAIIPSSVVMPILIFVGIISVGQSFEIVERKYYPAVILAIVIMLVSFVSGNGINNLKDFVTGDALLAILFATILVFIIDEKYVAGLLTSIFIIILIFLGIIFSEGVIFTEMYKPNYQYVYAFLFLTIVFLVLLIYNKIKKMRYGK